MKGHFTLGIVTLLKAIESWHKSFKPPPPFNRGALRPAG